MAGEKKRGFTIHNGNQERIKLREWIPHIGRPSTHCNPSKVILERVGFPADNISSSFAWNFREGVVVQKHVGSARVAMNAKQERMKRVYPLLMRNDNRFLRVFSLLRTYQSALASRNRKPSEDSQWKEIKFQIMCWQAEHDSWAHECETHASKQQWFSLFFFLARRLCGARSIFYWANLKSPWSHTLTLRGHGAFSNFFCGFRCGLHSGLIWYHKQLF